MKKNIGLTFVLLIAAFIIRIWHIGLVPPSPSLDEVSIGFNAYSILTTGKDEYGEVLPTLLRAYDDWRPALYVYLVIPMVALFGLTSTAVRVPSVILSLVSLYAIYSVARLLEKKYLKTNTWAIWTLAFATFSPWHIYLSRLGHEVNLGFTLFTVAVYFLALWIVNPKSFLLFWTSVFFAGSLWGYQSQKLIVPVFLIGAFLIVPRMFVKYRKQLLASLTVFVLVSLPVVLVTFGPNGLTRLRGTSAFGDSNPRVVQSRAQHAQAVIDGNKLVQIQTSKYLTYVSIFLDNYFRHFSFGWLFEGSGREDHKIPYVGLFFAWQGFLILMGIWVAWHLLPKHWAIFIGLWIVTSPLAASITTGAPHAMRAYTMFAPLVLLAGLGASQVKYNQRFVAGIILFLLSISSSHMLFHYFVTFPKTQSDSFSFALRDGLRYSIENQSHYEHIEVSHQKSLYQSYMFYLFFSKTNPVWYQGIGGTVSGGYEASHQIGLFSFGYLPQKTTDLKPETLYLYDVSEVPSGASVKAKFTNRDEKVAIVAVTKP